MFEIHVTVHCPDLVAAAQLLAQCTGNPAPAAPADPVVAPPAPAPAPATPAPAQLQHPAANPTMTAGQTIPSTIYPSEAPAPAVAAPASVPLAQAPTFTLAEISKAGADLIGANPGLLPKVNELLTQYGIQTLDKLKPDQFGAFATALRGLGAKI